MSIGHIVDATNCLLEKTENWSILLEPTPLCNVHVTKCNPLLSTLKQGDTRNTFKCIVAEKKSERIPFNFFPDAPNDLKEGNE